jgi:8-oxo-dGTP diphosphatase
VIIRDGRILLTQRKATQDFPFCWESPGGKVEGDESHHAALSRELKEELGLVGLAMKEIPLWSGSIDRQRPEDGKAFVHLYRVFDTYESVVQKPRPLEGQGIGWFDDAELGALLLAPANNCARVVLMNAVARSRK